MTSAERSHIDNAIWLCADHADLIDRDEVTYTARRLQAMKREHEVLVRKSPCRGQERRAWRRALCPGARYHPDGRIRRRLGQDLEPAPCALSGRRYSHLDLLYRCICRLTH